MKCNQFQCHWVQNSRDPDHYVCLKCDRERWVNRNSSIPFFPLLIAASIIVVIMSSRLVPPDDGADAAETNNVIQEEKQQCL